MHTYIDSYGNKTYFMQLQTLKYPTYPVEDGALVDIE